MRWTRIVKEKEDEEKGEVESRAKKGDTKKFVVTVTSNLAHKLSSNSRKRKIRSLSDYFDNGALCKVLLRICLNLCLESFVIVLIFSHL